MSSTDELLAWSGWYWMSGMQTDLGEIVHGVKDGEPCEWSWHPCGWSELSPISGSRPDLEHVGTLGCIEHGLLRDAWGPGCDFVTVDWSTRETTIDIRRNGTSVYSGDRLPRADALVRACLAAPPRGES